MLPQPLLMEAETETGGGRTGDEENMTSLGPQGGAGLRLSGL